MFASISIDTMMTKNNQNISTEHSNEFLIDPLRELVNTIRSCSAIGLPRFLAHKAKTSLSLTIESLRSAHLIDISTLLYIITMVGALTSIRISINTFQSSVYLMDMTKLKRIWSIDDQKYLKNHQYFSYDTSKIYQISGLVLTLLSIIIPLFMYNSLNSLVIL